jgi:hypothetical protein
MDGLVWNAAETTVLAGNFEYDLCILFYIIYILLQEVFWSVGNKRAELRMKTKPLKNTGQALHVLYFYPCSISARRRCTVMSLYDVQCALILM